MVLLTIPLFFSISVFAENSQVIIEIPNPWMVEKITLDDSNSSCGSGTIFDSDLNSCILLKTDEEIIDKDSVDKESEEEEIFEFDIRRKTYSFRDPIYIAGEVKYIKNPPYINIKISEDSGMLVENVYVFPKKDNSFFYHTKAKHSWEIPMTYEVKITYGGYSETKYFDLVNTSKDYDPQSISSLQNKLALAQIKNHQLIEKIKELEKSLIEKQEEMENLFCYAYSYK